MRKAAQKLKSERGASLMMGLLLFLACAVVGSAVLVAGTAASGRMTKIAEMDQRYYSVNSAAGLLVDLFKDEVVKVKVVEKTGGSPTTTLYKYDRSTKSYTAVSAGSSLPVETARLVAGMGSDAEPLTPEVKLTAPGNEVKIEETIRPDGRLEFVISSIPASGAAESEKYELQLVFAAEKSQNRSVKTEETAEGTETTTTTETSITWKLSDVK